MNKANFTTTNPKAMIAIAVLIQARKVRSFAKWSVALAFFLSSRSIPNSFLCKITIEREFITQLYSKASLYKKVKSITGLTPHGLIKQFRLKKAADLLKNSNLSVSEVIYETGFNSRSYFYKSFNEVFHCHPKDFGNSK
jgi:hypothetical protein